MTNSFLFDEEILARYLSGAASEQDMEIIKNWVSSNPDAEAYLEKLSKLWKDSSKIQDIQSINLDQNWAAIQQKLNHKPHFEIHRKKGFSTNWIAKIAALLLLAIGLSYFSYHYVSEHNTEITASADTLKTLTLPDGSKVWLNKTASISWDKTFGKKTRMVKLDGEAFFEVVKNPNKPFSVSSQNTSTTVLGTSFNVKSSKNSVEVSLLSGKVNFTSKNEKAILLPGEKATTGSEGIQKSKLLNHNDIAWKTKTLSFQNTPMEEVIADMANYYEVDFEFENPELQYCTLTGEFKNLSLPEMTQELSFLLDLQFQKGEKKILIHGKNCQ